MNGFATMRAMIELGLSDEQKLALLTAMEADATPKDRTAAERQQRHRDKVKAERDAVTRDVTRDVDPSPLNPPLKVSPDPFKIPPPISPQPVDGRKAREGFRLPDDWKPQRLGPDTVSSSILVNRGQEWAKRALESFRNHWRSANGPNARKRDWQAAWANWIIEQDNRDGKRTNSNGLGRNQPPDGLSPTTRAANRVFGPPDAGIQH